MTGPELAILAILALVTSAMSAVAGMGGGVVLLAGLTVFLPPEQAIPVQAAIQIAANASRVAFLRPHVNWSIVIRHAALLIPAGFLGLIAANAIPRDAGRGLIGVFALAIVWKPSPTSAAGPMRVQRFYGVGALQGFLNIPLGATGPLVAPFFRRATPDRLAFVATFAAAQTVGHVVKIFIFSTDGFAFGDHLLEIAVGVVAVSVGSLIGTHILGRFDEATFRRIFVATLTALAVQLIVTPLV